MTKEAAEVQKRYIDEMFQRLEEVTDVLLAQQNNRLYAVVQATGAVYQKMLSDVVLGPPPSLRNWITVLLNPESGYLRTCYAQKQVLDALRGYKEQLQNALQESRFQE